MKKELDIHNYSKRFKAALKMVEESDISDRNKRFIFDFRSFCSLNGIGVPLMLRYLGVLNYLALLIV